MTDEKRPDAAKGRVTTDDRGHSVLDTTIKTANFELVSTQRLQALLADEQAGHREAAARLAGSDRDGFLAQDSATGHLHIIDDDDLQALLDHPDEKPSVARPAEVTLQPESPPADEELSLVSTQRLRKLLDIPDDKTGKASPSPVKDDAGGFDPYNSG